MTGFFFLSLAACDTMNIPAGGTAGSLKDTSASPTSDDKPSDVSPSKLASLGNQQYNKEIEERQKNNEIETSTKVTGQMDGIFEQLKAAALIDEEYGSVAKEMDWRLNTIRDKTIVMAKAYPGGGVAIYDGVFDVAETEGALASILGHEMAHVLAQHELKRLAGHTAVAGATLGSAIALAMKPKKREQQVAAGVTGALALGYLLGGRQAWERSQEHDADCLGLRLAAKAGYDPKKIEGFWRRMAENKEEANTKYQFLNDHPIDDERLGHIQNTCMSKAQEVYSQVDINLRKDALATLPGVGFEG
ncbi:M48 family metallopeptidase [Candidatus Nitrospira nitrosa]|uniref:M48 family metallopeptidase n=1 Tax=Candidatus Nitrospira nitrosa TaxID=1742972 RepID=UPI00159EF3C8|nr:M48 family metallopeptidase [Candidatus Nitrospira nitrosa]